MQPKPAEQTAKEAIETYCRTWKELERCRDKVTKLSQENTALNERLKEYRWDRERHRNQMQAEKQFRERLNNISLLLPSNKFRLDNFESRYS